MGRVFDLPHPGRSLKICVSSVDEAWELWLCERDRRLILGAVLSIDIVVEAWREGRDAILLMAERIRNDVESGEVGLPACAEGAECRDS